jgi:hypothetical protein
LKYVGKSGAWGKLEKAKRNLKGLKVNSFQEEVNDGPRTEPR